MAKTKKCSFEAMNSRDDWESPAAEQGRKMKKAKGPTWNSTKDLMPQTTLSPQQAHSDDAQHLDRLEMVDQEEKEDKLKAKALKLAKNLHFKQMGTTKVKAGESKDTVKKSKKEIKKEKRRDEESKKKMRENEESKKKSVPVLKESQFHSYKSYQDLTSKLAAVEQTCARLQNTIDEMQGKLDWSGKVIECLEHMVESDRAKLKLLAKTKTETEENQAISFTVETIQPTNGSQSDTINDDSSDENRYGHQELSVDGFTESDKRNMGAKAGEEEKQLSDSESGEVSSGNDGLDSYKKYKIKSKVFDQMLKKNISASPKKHMLEPVKQKNDGRVKKKEKAKNMKGGKPTWTKLVL